MINTFKSKGIGTIADVVINHHNTNGWWTFPSETWNSNTYQLQTTDICSDDDGGATATQAATDGVTLSSNSDEGEDWSGCRDLDHKSSNVQTIVKAYEQYLVQEMGYTGFRYDMVKGFYGSHVADYNTAAGVEYSVGEYWDGNAQTVKNWIDSASMKSAAFDFPFRYTVRDAINNSDWSYLSNASVMSDENYRQYAVTFVENHDTEYRSASEQQDPITKDTLAANAFLLAMPGTPCVFLKHWQAYPHEIAAMIEARQVAGVTNQSSYTNFRSSATHFANNVSGANGNLLVVVGTTSLVTPSNTQWTKILDGYHYAYYLSRATETAWADMASGEYDEAFDVTLTAVSATDGAELVYTLDGTTPTASNGTQVESGSTVNISGSCTLTVGLLINGVVSGVITRSYTISQFEPYTIEVYVNADEAGTGWEDALSTASAPYLNFWTWGGDGTHAPSNTSWPGDKVTTMETVAGKKWFVNSYTINSKDDYVSFVFSVGTGSPQTVDLNYVTQTNYYTISSEKDGEKNKITNVTSSDTGIGTIEVSEPSTSRAGVYTLDGRRLRTTNSTEGLQQGIYIVDGKKVVVR